MATKASQLTLMAQYTASDGKVNSDLIDNLDSSQFLRSDTSDTMTGRLTIGTSSANSLVINNTDNTSTNHDILTVTSGAGGGFAVGVQDASLTNPVWNIRTYSSESIAIGDAYDEYVRFDGVNNRVGIGTTNPSEKLHVNGSIRSTSNSNNFNVEGAQLDWLATDNATRISGYASTGGAIIFYTNSNGSNTTKRLEIDPNGHVLPVSTSTYDLGSPTREWRNIYTGDLHLSNANMPNGNVADGTRGRWTIQEGEENLYIINNITEKVYKFSLELVDDVETLLQAPHNQPSDGEA